MIDRETFRRLLLDQIEMLGGDPEVELDLLDLEDVILYYAELAGLDHEDTGREQAVRLIDLIEEGGFPSKHDGELQEAQLVRAWFTGGCIPSPSTEIDAVLFLVDAYLCYEEDLPLCMLGHIGQICYRTFQNKNARAFGRIRSIAEVFRGLACSSGLKTYAGLPTEAEVVS